MPRGLDCSIANALGVNGEQWTLLALREVLLGQRRFDQIARNTGASRDIHAARLRKLVAAGVLERRQCESKPPRYEYVPTDARPGTAAHPAWSCRLGRPLRHRRAAARRLGARLRRRTAPADRLRPLRPAGDARIGAASPRWCRPMTSASTMSEKDVR